MKRICKQCGKEFVITQSEINFYKSKNLSIPKRCKECRQSNKAQKGNVYRKVADIPVESTVKSNSSQETRKSPMPKIVTAALIAIAVIYGVFFGGIPTEDKNGAQLEFRSEKLLNEHYEKHGIEMGFSSADEYEDAAEDVVENEDALHKIEAEDGIDYYNRQ